MPHDRLRRLTIPESITLAKRDTARISSHDPGGHTFAFPGPQPILSLEGHTFAFPGKEKV